MKLSPLALALHIDWQDNFRNARDSRVSRLGFKKPKYLILLVILCLLVLSSYLGFVKGGPAATLHLSLPAGTYQPVDSDPWLSEGWLLNVTGTSGTLTLRINDTSATLTSYDSHLIVSLNNASYNNLLSLSINSTTIPKTAFTYGTPNPYGVWTWPSGDVYPTWFADIYVFGTLNPKKYKDLIISVSLLSPAGARMHFDAYGSEVTSPPPRLGKLTHNGISEDSTALFWPTSTAQYYLTVSSLYGTVGGQGWYVSGNTAYATLHTGVVNYGNGTQRVFLYWSGDASGTSYAQSNPIFMNGNKTAIAVWKTQYYLTVTSPYGTTGGEGWYDAGSMAHATLNTGSLDHGNGTRHVFLQWSGDASGTDYAQSNPITINGPKTAIANWKIQYLLAVRTDPSELSPQPTRDPIGEAGSVNSWWYDISTNVTLIAQTISGYSFLIWDVDGVSQGNGGASITVTMNAPHTVTAHYVGIPLPPSPQVPVGGHSISLAKPAPTYNVESYAALIGSIGVVLILVKRKRK